MTTKEAPQLATTMDKPPVLPPVNAGPCLSTTSIAPSSSSTSSPEASSSSASASTSTSTNTSTLSTTSLPSSSKGAVLAIPVRSLLLDDPDAITECNPKTKGTGKERVGGVGSYKPCAPSVLPKIEWGDGPVPGEKPCKASGRRSKKRFWKKLVGR